MKSIILNIAKNIAYQLVFIFLIIGGIAFASLSWPTNSPLGETTGGKIMIFINNILTGCTIEGEYIKGYESNGLPICSKPEGGTIINAVCGTSDGTSITTTPTLNLCNEGTPTTVITNTANFTWSCNGFGGGSDVNCSAYRQYNVTFDGNGGTGHTPTSKIATYNTALGTLPNNPTRTGYIFNGWFTSTSGGTQITTSTIITGNISYYAQWSLSINCPAGQTFSYYNYAYSTGLQGGIPCTATTPLGTYSALAGTTNIYAIQPSSSVSLYCGNDGKWYAGVENGYNPTLNSYPAGSVGLGAFRSPNVIYRIEEAVSESTTMYLGWAACRGY